MSTPNRYSGKGGFTIRGDTNASDAVEQFRGSGAERLRGSESRRRNLRTYAEAYADRDVRIVLGEFETATVQQRPDEPPIVRIPNTRYEQLATSFDREKFDQKVQYAMVVHELGHILYTPSEYAVDKLDDLPRQQMKSAKQIWNALEDGAIEEQLRHDLGEKIGKRLATLHANLSESQLEDATFPIKHGFMQAVHNACLDLGRYDSGSLRALRDEDDDRFQWVNDEHEDLFENFFDEIEQVVQDVLTTSDPYERTDRIFEFWDDLMEYLDTNNAEDEANQSEQQGQQGQSQQGDSQDGTGNRGMPNDADSDTGHGEPQAAEDLGENTDVDDVQDRIRSVTKEEPQTDKSEDEDQPAPAEEDEDSSESNTNSTGQNATGEDNEDGEEQTGPESGSTDSQTTQNEDGGETTDTSDGVDGPENEEPDPDGSDASSGNADTDHNNTEDETASGEADTETNTVDSDNRTENEGEAEGSDSDEDGNEGKSGGGEKGGDEQKTLMDFGSDDSSDTTTTEDETDDNNETSPASDSVEDDTQSGSDKEEQNQQNGEGSSDKPPETNSSDSEGAKESDETEGSDGESPDENAPPGTGEEGLNLPDEDTSEDDPLDKQLNQEKQETEQADKPLEEEIGAFADALEDMAESNNAAGNGASDTSIESLEFRPEPNGSFIDEAWSDAERKSQNTARLLERELKRERRDDHRRGLPSGEVDGSMLYGLESGNLNVFQQRHSGREKDYHVMVVLDRSTSMANNRNSDTNDIEIAEEAVVEFGLALERLGIDVCIMDMHNNRARLISPFGVDVERSKEALVNRDTSGGTPLHESLAIGRRRLEQMPGSTFMLMVTDGKPGNKDGYTDELGNCEMPVLGINLALGEDREEAVERLDEQKQFYDSNAIVTSPERLNQELESMIYGIAF